MKDIKTAIFIAYKSLVKGSKSTLLLLVFILALSYLNMMFISGILAGLQNVFETTMINVLTSHITVGPEQEPEPKQYILNADQVRRQIESIPGVLATARHYSLAGSISFDKDKNGITKSVSGTIIGIDPIQEEKVLTIYRLLKNGQYLSPTDTDQIIISSALAGGYGVPAPSDLGGVRAKDKVKITYPNGVIRTYTVKGIYDDTIGIFETFITTREAESVLNTYNSASQILVKTDLSLNTLNGYEHKIKLLEPKLKVQNFLDILGTVAAFLNALNLISFIVGFISVLVAAITIFVLVYINAISKARQIGILRAIGIKQRIVVLSYVLQSLFYAFCGVLAGAFLVFAVLTPLLNRYPINIDFGYLSLVHRKMVVVLGTISLVAAGLLAGFVPARIVAKKDILKAIWG
ncbi:MAG: FtsX-like permease family protein [Patescibacteria group bacterium]|nr:FtsX-like permease family protein [Patescibacteria group bacterium]